MSADRQAQPGAAKAPSGRHIGLVESLEYSGLVFFRDPDAGIAHRAVEAHSIGLDSAVHVQAYDDLAAVGELDGIAHQVDQDLSHPRCVGDEPTGHLRGNLAGQFKALLVGADGQCFHHPVQQLPDIHRRHLQG